MKKKKRKRKAIGYRILKIFLWIILSIFILLFLLLLFIRSPWGQNIIVQRATTYISNKTHTQVAIDKLFITLQGNIMLKGLYLEDTAGDTLVYSKSLEIDVPIIPIVKGETIVVKNIDWQGLKAKVVQQDTIKGYNFQFLIDAFTTDTSAEQGIIEEKEKNEKPLILEVNNILFRDFDLVYYDVATGIDTDLKFGELEMNIKTMDLQSMNFHISNVYLSDVFVRLKQFEALMQTEDEANESVLPYLQLDKLTLKDIAANYESMENKMEANLDLGYLFLKMPQADLENQKIFIDRLELNHTTANLNMYSKPSDIEENRGAPPQVFSWPEIILGVNEIKMKDNNMRLRMDDAQIKPNIFNPNALDITDFSFDAQELFLKDQTASAYIENLQFKEASGIHLKEFQLDIAADDKRIAIESFNLHLNNNKLYGKVHLAYPSLAKFMDKPETANLMLNLPNFQLDPREAFRFQPNLRANESLVTLSKHYVRGNLNASGGMKRITIPKATIFWGNTKLETTATVNNFMDTKQLSFEIPNFYAATKQEDILLFLSDEEQAIEYPDDILLTGEAVGNLNDMQVHAELLTSQGEAIAKGFWRNQERIDFDLEVEIKEYQLGELLKNNDFGNLSFTLQTNGSGPDINHLDLDLKAQLHHFSYQDYPIEDLILTANIEEGEGKLVSEYKDKNLDFNLDSFIVFDSISPEANLHLDMKGINLQKLGISDRDIRSAFIFDADFYGNREAYDIIATIGKGVFVHDDRTYLLGDVLATAHVESDTTSIWLDNKIARVQLESNATPERFANSVTQHIKSYFSRRKQMELAQNMRPVEMFVKGEINEDPLLNRILLMKVEKLDTVKIDLDYREAERKLVASVNAPHVNYDGSMLKNLKFNMNAIRENFDFDLGFDNIQASVFDLPQTRIEGEQIDNDLHINFKAIHKDEVFVNLPTVISGTAEELKLHVPPENIVLNSERWNTPQDNEVRLTKDKLSFHNFEFTKGNEAVRYLNDWLNINRDQATVRFENFNLKEILNYLNPEEEIAQGDLQGSLTVVNPFGRTGVLADLGISNLSFMDADLGTLSMKGRMLGTDKYNFSVALKEGMVDMDARGSYTTFTEAAPKMDVTLDINSFNVEALNGLSMGEIREGKGSLSGAFVMNGPLNDLNYQGDIDFENVNFTVTKFNAPFSLLQTKVNVDREGLYFDNFRIYDEYKNELTINGNVLTENFVNPVFDLKVVSDDFHIINAGKDDNDFVYGKASFDMDMDVKGDMLFPIVNMKLNIGEDTDITYILSRTTASLEKRDGVMEFVNREDPDAVLTAKDKEATSKTIKGMDFNALIKINKNAKLTIVLDKSTGDNFKAFGDGEFDFSIKPNGNMVLSGIYEIAGGHYEMNLYNLVNRKFELMDGGRVTWSGDIMDADLDVRAKYTVDASASPLMASVSSSSDASTQNKFRQVLPFLVYLNIGGEIMLPEVSFNLDMPEDKQGAIGGQVFGRVQQINQQEEELNRQVFSLLVLNRFFPDSGSDGSEGGFASIVRNNLNDAISDQLNNFSNKLLGSSGVELDFGLDSYTDYQGDTPEDRTQLDIAAQKKLFNDRLIVRVGSEVDLQGGSNREEETPIIGNVSVEYLLTPNGRYSLRGFRKNTYDNIIDGQLIVNGISLIFHNEFNEFRELWQSLIRGETREEKKLRKEQEELEKKKEEKKKELENLEEK